MTPIEIARKLAEYNQTQDAQKAYSLALQQQNRTPEEEMEAASYIFFSKGEYQVAYTTFVSLYNRGFYQTELLDIMTKAFYLPNVDKQKKQYEKNCKQLARYPYLFQKNFLDFDHLPILFFPFNDEGYLPFYKAENRFGEFVNFNHPVIDRYFFKDLDNPILTQDVYSQYQLEYLNDNVRKSEWVGCDNHIYLHYTDWEEFCAYLQCLNFLHILKEKKIVFLIEEEKCQYPIDFQTRFGIDYSQYPIKPIGIREVSRLIWHTQLSAHNGGDFFNEIFYGHPNLMAMESMMFETVIKTIDETKQKLRTAKGKQPPLVRELQELGRPTDKDILVASFMSSRSCHHALNPHSRIVPAIFFQPHFPNISYQLAMEEKNGVTFLFSNQYEEIRQSAVFQQFKYIKTFTPMRRFTTSYGATVRFSENRSEQKDNAIMQDRLSEALLNRSFMIDWQDRLYQDSILVRFEDGKLNPKATFTALAKFLDIPYTESMTYCSGWKGINPESMAGNVRGFDPATVYRTYDEFADDDERMLIEYFLRDAYETYGYTFHYYKGEPVNSAWVEERIQGACCLNRFIQLSWEKCLRAAHPDWTAKEINEKANDILDEHIENRRYITSLLMRSLHFVNKRGQPLRFMKQLELDLTLLEQPLYH